MYKRPIHSIAALAIMIMLTVTARAQSNDTAAATIPTRTFSTVVDSTKRVVGTLNLGNLGLSGGLNSIYVGSTALVGFNGHVFLLGVDQDGFVDTLGNYAWTSSDCSGPTMAQNLTSVSLVENMTDGSSGNVNQNVVYFASGPLVLTKLNSIASGHDSH